MFNKPVVFVIGAGASFEYNLPLGGTLKDAIAQKVKFRYQHGFQLISGDHELLDHIRRHEPDQARVNEYTKAANLLAAAIPSFISIDEALHYVGETSEAVEVGKVAIILEILEAERNSSLAFDRKTGTVPIDKIDGKWISEVLSMAMAGIQRRELETAFDQVTFINFNYDRAIEQYIYWALQQRMSATPQEAQRIVEKLNMVRPYGSIGPLSFNYNDERAYGASAYFDPFKRIADMRTYTDGKPLHDFVVLEKALTEAQMIIFLGFGYHATNLDLLKTTTKSSASIIGTAIGIHHQALGAINGRIIKNLRPVTGDVSLDIHLDATSLLRNLRQRILISLE